MKKEKQIYAFSKPMYALHTFDTLIKHLDI